MDLDSLFCCISSNKCEHEDRIVNYIKRGGDVNICNQWGYTLLMKACRHQFTIDTIKLILSKKIDINKQNMMGKMALMYAANFCDFEVVKLLLDYGADMDIKSNALFYAYTENFKLMLKYKYIRKPCCLYHVHAFIQWKGKYDSSYYNTILATQCLTLIDYCGYFYSICAGVI
jgi:ankyrin repeat protein